jgi:hypothetical protein
VPDGNEVRRLQATTLLYGALAVFLDKIFANLFRKSQAANER